MCSVKLLDQLGRADVGVLGFTAKDDTPRAVAVTPYLLDGQPLVTTTLALLTKAKMLRNRPAAALFAGGTHVTGDITTTMHKGSEWFDTNLRDLELHKYPPAKSLLSIPFHRRLFWWYVGRVAMTFESPGVSSAAGSNRATVTSVVDGTVTITPLADDLSIDDDVVDLMAEVPDGPACVLVHHETDGMAELLSVTVRGTVTNGRLTVSSRQGSLEPQDPGTVAQLKGLRALNSLAKANKTAIEAWETTEPQKGAIR